MIDEPEYLKERKRTGKVLTSWADMNRRRYLIEETVKCWYEVNPKKARFFMDYLNNITKVEHKKNGEWRNGQGYCSLRLPRELMVHFTNVFRQHAPDLEGFATNDSDIEILYSAFPKLMPQGLRTKARRN